MSGKIGVHITMVHKCKHTHRSICILCKYSVDIYFKLCGYTNIAAYDTMCRYT